jgi:hypothetical protein
MKQSLRNQLYNTVSRGNVVLPDAGVRVGTSYAGEKSRVRSPLQCRHCRSDVGVQVRY